MGRIAGAFGIKGEIKVDPSTDFLGRFDKGKSLILNGKSLKITSSRPHKGRPLIKLEGIEDATAVEKLQWAYLEVPASDKPETDDDEFIIDELIGMTVVTEDGDTLGELEEVLVAPAHDIFVVGDVMIPGVKEFVRMIDFEANTITVRLIPGMRDETEAETA